MTESRKPLPDEDPLVTGRHLLSDDYSGPPITAAVRHVLRGLVRELGSARFAALMDASHIPPGDGWQWDPARGDIVHALGARVRMWHIGREVGWMWWRAMEAEMQVDREPAPTLIEAAALALSEPDPAPPKCTHEGIGLPDCETCDPTTDRNQDRRRRAKSPVCPDCGSRGELVTKSIRHCDDCDVRFGWMVSAKDEPDAAPDDPHGLGPLAAGPEAERESGVKAMDWDQVYAEATEHCTRYGACTPASVVAAVRELHRQMKGGE